MPTLNAAQTATVSLTVPNAYLTVDCSSGAVVDVSWVSAGSISGKRTVQNISEDVGPFADQTVVTLYCRSGTASYSTTGDQATQAALQALVSGARNVGGMSPYLARRKQTVLECWAGKIKSVANGADYCTRVFRTLECHADRIRMGVINCVAADLVNVRVSVGTSDTMPADLASLHGSTTTGGAILSNGALTTGAAFTALAGTSVTRPKITWGEWMDIRTVNRADGGTLPAIRVTIEIPATGNPNRPAYDTASTRAGWESQGDAATAPYGRCYKARNGAGLGVTTPSAGSSTVWSDETIPFVIEYVPRDGVMPVSLTVYGDSIPEGSGGTPFGHGFIYEARARLSTLTQPMGVCMMAMASATQAEYADRVEAVSADLASEVAILGMLSPNGITAPTFSEASSAPAQRRANQRARAALAAQNALLIGFSGIPMEAAFKDLDAASVAVFNAYVDAVRNGNMPMIDAWAAMAGKADAEGQINCIAGTLADGVHPNQVGHRDRIAPEAIRVLRQLLLAPAA